MSMITELVEDMKRIGEILQGIGMPRRASTVIEGANVIQELAEKLHSANMERSIAYYNNGWIPCEDRLPEEPYGCLVTIDDCNPVTGETFANLLPYFVGYDGEQWHDADGEQIPFEVLAWMPLPEPYKGESNGN